MLLVPLHTQLALGIAVGDDSACPIGVMRCLPNLEVLTPEPAFIQQGQISEPTLISRITIGLISTTLR
jgi:hypothetical protein